MANLSQLILLLILVYVTAHCWRYLPKMGDKIKHFVRFGHIPLLIVLQIIFIICFAVFVDYDPITAKPHGSGTYKAGKDTKGEEFKTSNEEGADHYSGYPSKWSYLFSVKWELDSLFQFAMHFLFKKINRGLFNWKWPYINCFDVTSKWKFSVYNPQFIDFVDVLLLALSTLYLYDIVKTIVWHF